jgi:hypothetical protein
VTTENAIVNVKPVGSDAGIIYLAFSVVIVTQDSNNVELLVLETTSTPGTYISLYGNSSKFNFDFYGGSPHMVYFMQWVTGADVPTNETFVEYAFYTYFYTYPPQFNYSY